MSVMSACAFGDYVYVNKNIGRWLPSLGHNICYFLQLFVKVELFATFRERGTTYWNIGVSAYKERSQEMDLESVSGMG